MDGLLWGLLDLGGAVPAGRGGGKVGAHTRAGAWSGVPDSRSETRSTQSDDSTADAEEEGFLCSTELAWLEKYWERVHKGRTYPWMETPLAEFPSSSWRKRRPSQKCDIGSVTLTDLVKEESVQKDRYTVSLHSDNGLGIRWFICENGRVLVNKLIPSHKGDVSVAQAGQQIAVGDELVRVNGRSLVHMDDLSIVQLMQSMDHMAKREVTLTFQYTCEGDPGAVEMEAASSEAIDATATGYSSRAVPSPGPGHRRLARLRTAADRTVLARPSAPVVSEATSTRIRASHLFPSLARVSSIEQETDPQALQRALDEHVLPLVHSQLSSFFVGHPSPLLAAPEWLPQASYAVRVAPDAGSEAKFLSLVHSWGAGLEPHRRDQGLGGGLGVSPLARPAPLPVGPEKPPSGRVGRRAWLLSCPDYLRSYRTHAIPLDHEQVQVLLSQPWPRVVSSLHAAMDPPSRAVLARQADTKMALSLPPFDVTYLLLYAILEQRDVVLMTSDLEELLDRWASLFSAPSFGAAYQALQRLERWDGKSMRVYFGNDVATTTECKPFVDIVRDLASLWLVFKCHGGALLAVDRLFHPPPPPPPTPAARFPPTSPTHRASAGEWLGRPSEDRVLAEPYRARAFKHLPLRLVDGTVGPPDQLGELLDLHTSKLVKQTWGLLNRDLVLCVAARRQLLRTCSAVWSLAAEELAVVSAAAPSPSTRPPPSMAPPLSVPSSIAAATTAASATVQVAQSAAARSLLSGLAALAAQAPQAPEPPPQAVSAAKSSTVPFTRNFLAVVLERTLGAEADYAARPSEWVSMYADTLRTFRLPKTMHATVFLHVLRAFSLGCLGELAVKLLVQHFGTVVDGWLFKVAIFGTAAQALGPDRPEQRAAAVRAYFSFLTQTLREEPSAWTQGAFERGLAGVSGTANPDATPRLRPFPNEWLELTLQLSSQIAGADCDALLGRGELFAMGGDFDLRPRHGALLATARSIILRVGRSCDALDAMQVCAHFGFWQGVCLLATDLLRWWRVDLTSAAWRDLTLVLQDCFYGAGRALAVERTSNVKELHQYMALVRCVLRQVQGAEEQSRQVVEALLARPARELLEHLGIAAAQAVAQGLVSILRDTFGFKGSLEILQQLPEAADLLDPMFLLELPGTAVVHR